MYLGETVSVRLFLMPPFELSCCGFFAPMEHFSGEQRAFCVKAFYENAHSYVQVQRAFRNHYNLRYAHQGPSANLIKQWIRKFQVSGSTVCSKPRGRRRSVRNEINIEAVNAAVRQNPHRSIRKHAFALHLNRSSVQRILKKDLHYHPYKIQLVQALKNDDYRIRLNFATLMQDFNDFDNILFSDEAHFHLDGYVNKQNCRYWSAENPREKHEVALHTPKVTVWAAMSSRGIIGPYFFENNQGQSITVNAQRYSSMIRNFVGPALQAFDGFDNRTWFQQDGATSHTANESLVALRMFFPEKLISRRGDIDWPARSCDLTPLDFFLWGYLKSKVYVNPPANVNELKDRIREQITAIPVALCERIILNARHRLDECIRCQGQHLDDIIFKV